MDPVITELHSTYCQATGFDLPLRMGRDRVWFDFDKAGFTKEDLLLVVKWIRRQISRNGSGYSIASLRFSTLLQLDAFEEKLLLAKQELGRRPRSAPVVEQKQRVGDIERIIEVPAPSGEPVAAGAVGKNVLREWRLAQRRGGAAAPLPTS